MHSKWKFRQPARHRWGRIEPALRLMVGLMMVQGVRAADEAGESCMPALIMGAVGLAAGVRRPGAMGELESMISVR